jgi:CRISPR-associated protein Csa3
MTEKHVLITPIYKSQNILRAVAKVKVDKVILVADVEDNSEDVDNAIEEIHETLDDIVEIEVVRADPYDMPDIVSKVSKKIEQEKENKISLNVTPGRKIQAFSLAFAGFSNQDDIDEIFYLKEEGGKLHIPMLEISMSENKKKVLSGISEGSTNVDSLEANMDISKTMIYNHIKDLKENGYIIEEDDGIKITEAGELMIALLG